MSTHSLDLLIHHVQLVALYHPFCGMEVSMITPPPPVTAATSLGRRATSPSAGFGVVFVVLYFAESEVIARSGIEAEAEADCTGVLWVL